MLKLFRAMPVDSSEIESLESLQVLLKNLESRIKNSRINSLLRLLDTCTGKRVGKGRRAKAKVSKMDELVKKIAALGLPGIILVVTMAATGLTGAAAITAALAFLGGPAGMLGGIAVLGLTGLITDALTKVGLEDLLTAIYCQRRLSEPHGKLLDEIEQLSLFDGDIKERLKQTVTDGCGCEAENEANISDITLEARAILEAVPGMTPAHHRDFNSSNPIMRRAGRDSG